MTDQERIADLEAHLRQRDQMIAELQALVSDLQRQIAELRAQLAKDSHNSSKPPSSDGLKHRRYSPRPPSARKTGGQPGHHGSRLERQATPDHVVRHRPTQCAWCQHDLTEVAGEVVETRQVLDVPVPHLEATAHQAQAIRCPACQQVTRADFPPTVRAAVQYGPRVQAIAVYLHQYHLLPDERTCQAVADLLGARISEGTLERWGRQAAVAVAPQVERIAAYVRASAVDHTDETGIRIRGVLHWLHTHSTRFLTLVQVHAKRGAEAMDALGILPGYRGTAMHDRFASYDQYACRHQLCKAHLLRDLTFIAETAHHTWAERMRALVSAMHAARQEWTARGAERLPDAERTEWVLAYFTILRQGYTELPPHTPVPKSRGRSKQHPAKNLLDALVTRAEQVLGFLDDGALPFTNNEAERSLRVGKLQQKIAGTFRSDAGAQTFCGLRSYLATLRKQGQSLFHALYQTFLGYPLPVAWGS